MIQKLTHKNLIQINELSNNSTSGDICNADNGNDESFCGDNICDENNMAAHNIAAHDNNGDTCGTDDIYDTEGQYKRERHHNLNGHLRAHQLFLV